jgi:hypothetical protein
MATSLEDRLFTNADAPGPKRILALDGGGARGVLTCGILERVEHILAARTPDPDAFRLSDYFDLIGGTSTGSILAVGLALGWRVRELRDLYLELCPQIFGDPIAKGLNKAKFDHAVLERILTERLCERTLGSRDLKTGLALFAKRIDTGSPWSLSNNPKARYWSPETALANGYASSLETFFPNRDYRLVDLVRASAAAPTFFDEVTIELGAEKLSDGTVLTQKATFMDGALGGFNNPALQLFLMATSRPYGFSWQASEDRLLICSVGTGLWRPVINDKVLREAPGGGHIAREAMQAVEALRGMVVDTANHATAVLQSLSRPAVPWIINSEVQGGELLLPQPVLTFQRYDVRLDVRGLRQDLGIDTVVEDDIARMRRLDQADPHYLERLYWLGRYAGDRSVHGAHFPAGFDLPAWQVGTGETPAEPDIDVEAEAKVLADFADARVSAPPPAPANSGAFETRPATASAPREPALAPPSRRDRLRLETLSELFVRRRPG